MGLLWPNRKPHQDQKTYLELHMQPMNPQTFNMCTHLQRLEVTGCYSSEPIHLVV